MFLLSSNYWEIKDTPQKGRGVFAKKDIEAGTLIGDYLGKIIPDSEEEAYKEKYTHLYTMYYTDDASIVPDPNEEGIHLINNSCEPNCYIYTYQGHTLYFALRHIFKGEEITVSYLMPPLDEDCNPCTDLCKCDSEFCTGIMHISEKNYKIWLAYDEELTKDFIVPPVVLGEMLQKLPSYPKTIKDHEVFPLFGSEHHEPVSLPDTKFPSKKQLRKLIRETGRQLLFPKIGILVMGVYHDHIFCKRFD